MIAKIITLPETQTEVCLHRDCNAAGEEIVCIKTFVVNSEGTELMLETKAKFATAKSAQQFLQHSLKEEKIWVD